MKMKKKMDREGHTFLAPLLDLPMLLEENSAKKHSIKLMTIFLCFTPFPLPLHRLPCQYLHSRQPVFSSGVDYCDSITMYFKDKRVAQLKLHQESVLSNCAVISGDKGNIEVSGMNCKFQDKEISL